MRKIFWLLLAVVMFSAGWHRSPAQWIQTAGPEGGYISSIAEDDSFFYAATLGPLFRMQKGDSTWNPLPPVAPHVPGDLRSLLSTGTELVAGTDGAGVFRSTDHGITWQRWNSGLHGAEGIGCFALRGNDLLAGTNLGMYVSTDGGANWSPSNVGMESIGVSQLLVRDSSLFAGTRGCRLYRSTDYGAHWNSANVGLTADVVTSLAALDTNLYAGTWWGGGVYRSTDNGEAWQVFGEAIYNLIDVNALAVMGRTIVAGLIRGGVFRATDGGYWDRGRDHGPASVVTFQTSGSQILAGTFDGVYVSPDTGDSWNPAFSGLIGSEITVLLNNGAFLFAGTRMSGLHRSTDGGSSWTKTKYGENVISLVAVGNDYFAGETWGVRRSTDGGMNWSPAGLWDGNVSLAVITSDNGNPCLFAGTDSNGVYLSTDRGENWTQVNSGLSDTMVHCLTAMDTSLFAATNSGVFHSTDKGASWARVTSGLADTYVQCFAVSGTNLFAGTADSGVFRTSDGGKSWSQVNNGITHLNIVSLAACGSRVLAGTSPYGLFFSENSGTTWSLADTGLQHFIVSAIVLGDTVVFAGTRGNGVWQRPLQEMLTGVIEPSPAQPTSFHLEQNYPNPFNPTTTIKYHLPTSTMVRLSVFDILGREVSVLVHERRDAGVHEVKFDAAGLSSGVYFYQLKAGEFVQTEKLLLIH